MNYSKILGATFLIAGTCIGAGMLALPVYTGIAGFLPSLFVITLAYLFMISTGLLLAEANLWMEEGVHVVTMASKLLGKPGKIITVILYLFMGYGSLISYDSGGSTLIQDFMLALGIGEISREMACAIFGIVFGCMIAFGTAFISRVNFVLVLGMISFYFIIVGVGISQVEIPKLTYVDWNQTTALFPLLLATFSYQMIVPSLTSYLERDPKSLRFSIILGTTIPFVIYVLWELIVLGIVPVTGTNSLEWANQQAVVATKPLRYYTNFPFLTQIAESFSFFALITSFLGIALGLFDFLSDLTRIQKKGWGKLALLMAVVFPTLFFSILYPDAFLIALEVTGGYGDTIFSGLIPIAMVWIGRYHRHIEGPYRAVGGKPLLVFVAAFYGFVIIIQTLSLIGAI